MLRLSIGISSLRLGRKREEPDEEELRRLFEMLEFRSLIDRQEFKYKKQGNALQLVTGEDSTSCAMKKSSIQIIPVQ